MVIEAFQWTGDADQLDDPVWIVEASKKRWGDDNSVRFAQGCLDIFTPEGIIIARRGDYVIRDIKGEIYACMAVNFEAAYEPVEEE